MSLCFYLAQAFWGCPIMKYANIRRLYFSLQGLILCVYLEIIWSLWPLCQFSSRISVEMGGLIDSFAGSEHLYYDCPSLYQPVIQWYTGLSPRAHSSYWHQRIFSEMYFQFQLSWNRWMKSLVFAQEACLFIFRNVKFTLATGNKNISQPWMDSWFPPLPSVQHNNPRKHIIYWQIVFIIGLWKL